MFLARNIQSEMQLAAAHNKQKIRRSGWWSLERQTFL